MNDCAHKHSFNDIGQQRITIAPRHENGRLQPAGALAMHIERFQSPLDAMARAEAAVGQNLESA